MAKTDFKTLQKLDEAEIKKQIGELSQKLFDMKMQNVGGQLKDFSQIGKSKLQIARLKTLLVQKGLSHHVAVQYTGVKMAPIKKEEVKKEAKKEVKAEKKVKPEKEKKAKVESKKVTKADKTVKVRKAK